MTAEDRTFLDAFEAVFGPGSWNKPHAPNASDLDEETLRRSHSGLSRSARREQRRSRGVRISEPWCDEVATPAEVRAAGWGS